MKTIWNKLKGNINEITTRKDAGRTCGHCGKPHKGKVTIITGSYHARSDDFYIAVNSTKATTIYLPGNPADGKILIIKSEMTPPILSRMITITTRDGILIDGYRETAISVSHDSKTLIYHNNGWHIIN